MASIFETEITSAFFDSTSTQWNGNNKVCLLSNNATYHGNKKLSDTSALINAYNYYYDVVDLGLPSGTLWSKKNLGALTDKDNGWYFSWGNLTGHSKGSGYDFSQAKYDTTSAASIDTDLTLAQDAARANLGGSWRMPTMTEFSELFNSSYTEYIDAAGTVISGTDKLTTYNGVMGLLLRSKANGNTLFFPAAGFYVGTSLNSEGSYGYYWSSSFNSATNARNLGFNSGGVNPQNGNRRRLGFSVRPVQ